MSMNSFETGAQSGHDAKLAVARAFEEMKNEPVGDMPAGRSNGSSTQHPLWLMLAAIALGYFAGTSLPMSDGERDRFGPLGDRLGNKAKGAANDLVDDAKTAATRALMNALGSGKR